MATSSFLLLSEPKIEGTLYTSDDSTGLAESISAVPKGQVQPAYHVAIARVLEPKRDELWRWFNLQEELGHPTAKKGYDDIGVAKGSTPYVLLVNGSLATHDGNALRAFVEGKGELDGRTDVGLVDRSIPISSKYSDRVLGERTIWTPYDGEVKEREVPIFSVDTYKEAVQDPEFLLKNPSFIVVMTEEQAAGYRHNQWLSLKGEKGAYVPDPRLVNHVPSHAMSGTPNVWQAMLRATATERKRDSVYAGMPELPENTARVGFVDISYGGFDFLISLDDGACIGVDPEGLGELVRHYVSFREPSVRLQSDLVQVVSTTPLGEIDTLAERISEQLRNYKISDA